MEKLYSQKIQARELFDKQEPVEKEVTVGYLVDMCAGSDTVTRQIGALSKAVLDNSINPHAVIYDLGVLLYATSPEIPERPTSQRQDDNVRLWMHDFRGETNGPGKAVFCIPLEQWGKENATVKAYMWRPYVGKPKELKKQLEITEKIASDATEILRS